MLYNFKADRYAIQRQYTSHFDYLLIKLRCSYQM